jgi:hypothetical protein
MSVGQSFCLSARLSTWNNSTPTGRIFIKFDLSIFRKCQKIQVSLKSEKKTGTAHEDQYKLLIISCSVLPKIKNISDNCCKENRNKHFIFNNPPPPENLADY